MYVKTCAVRMRAHLNDFVSCLMYVFVGLNFDIYIYIPQTNACVWGFLLRLYITIPGIWVQCVRGLHRFVVVAWVPRVPKGT